MIPKISFQSTYKVNSKDSQGFLLFQNFIKQNKNKNKIKTFYVDDTGSSLYQKTDIKEHIMIVPDDMDYTVETFCKDNGISYTKLETKDLLNPKTIARRIKAPNYSSRYKIVHVDSNKLENYAKKQTDSNIPFCEHEYNKNKHHHEYINGILRSGMDFYTTTLTITTTKNNKDLTESCNNKNIRIDFNIDENRCIYFGLKDLGMDKIPVYVDDSSYEAGKILGLFE